ncbi:MAG: hypothetical protein IJT83_10025 [Victivallales bacterium]|nr:hypothetical protein [Victivallales bacterium]
MTEDVIIELRDLLASDKIAHEGARNGSVALAGMSDNGLYQVFCQLLFDRDGPQTVLQRIHPDCRAGVDDGDLIAAMRRLSVVGGKLAAKIQNAAGQKKVRRKKAVTKDGKPLLPLDLHLKNAKEAKKDIDCVGRMASLATLLEQQLESLYTYPARQAQPFMGVRTVNMVMGMYKGTLESLHRMQMDVGIVEKVPEQMEINMRQAGAFQSYIGEMNTEHKQAMIDFAESFCKFAVEKAHGTPADDK